MNNPKYQINIYSNSEDIATLNGCKISIEDTDLEKTLSEFIENNKENIESPAKETIKKVYSKNNFTISLLNVVLMLIIISFFMNIIFLYKINQKVSYLHRTSNSMEISNITGSIEKLVDKIAVTAQQVTPETLEKLRSNISIIVETIKPLTDELKPL